MAGTSCTTQLIYVAVCVSAVWSIVLVVWSFVLVKLAKKYLLDGIYVDNHSHQLYSSFIHSIDNKLDSMSNMMEMHQTRSSIQHTTSNSFLQPQTLQSNQEAKAHEAPRHRVVSSASAGLAATGTITIPVRTPQPILSQSSIFSLPQPITCTSDGNIPCTCPTHSNYNQYHGCTHMHPQSPQTSAHNVYDMNGNHIICNGQVTPFTLVDVKIPDISSQAPPEVSPGMHVNVPPCAQINTQDTSKPFRATSANGDGVESGDIGSESMKNIYKPSSNVSTSGLNLSPKMEGRIDTVAAIDRGGSAMQKELFKCMKSGKNLKNSTHVHVKFDMENIRVEDRARALAIERKIGKVLDKVQGKDEADTKDFEPSLETMESTSSADMTHAYDGLQSKHGGYEASAVNESEKFDLNSVMGEFDSTSNVSFRLQAGHTRAAASRESERAADLTAIASNQSSIDVASCARVRSRASSMNIHVM